MKYYFNPQTKTFYPEHLKNAYANFSFDGFQIFTEEEYEKLTVADKELMVDENNHPYLRDYQPTRHHTWNVQKRIWEISSENLAKLFKQKKTALILRLKEKTEEFGATLTWEYPQCERDTFPIQKEEALKFKQGKTDELRCLPGIAKKRHLELSVLADKVIKKTVTFEYVSGLLTGERQKFMDKLNIATTVEQLEQIEQEIESWVFEVD